MYRNEKLLRAVAQLPCQICGLEGSTQAAHSNQLRDGKGRGLKAPDYRIAALCFKCHTEIDQGVKLLKQRRVELWDEAHRKTIGKLFEDGWLEVQSHPY
jgi:hypothetical protein